MPTIALLTPSQLCNCVQGLRASPRTREERGCCSPAKALPDKITPATSTSSIKHIAHILPTIYNGRPVVTGGDMKKIFFATGNANKLKEVRLS